MLRMRVVFLLIVLSSVPLSHAQVSSVAPDALRAARLSGYTLTVTTSGDAKGRVTASPAIVDATPLKKPKLLKPGARITLRAMPLPGMVFTGWSGDCSGQNSRCKITLSKNATVNAEFGWKNPESIKRTLTVELAGTKAGRVQSDPAGIDCGGGYAACTAQFYPYTPVTLTARPETSTAFLRWTGACNGTDAACVPSLTTNAAVTATFGAPDAILTVMAVGPGKGTVISDPPGIYCTVPGGQGKAGLCSKSFAGGTIVRLRAESQEGSTFSQWIENAAVVPFTTEYAVTVIQKTTVKARFDDLIGTAEQAILSQRCTKTRTALRTYQCTDAQSYAVCRKQFLLGAVRECVADFPVSPSVLISAPTKTQLAVTPQSDLEFFVTKGKRGGGSVTGDASILAQFQIP